MFINYKKISIATVTLNIFLSFVGLYFFEIKGLLAAIITTYFVKLILLYKDKNFLEKPKLDIQKLVPWSLLFLIVEFRNEIQWSCLGFIVVSRINSNC